MWGSSIILGRKIQYHENENVPKYIYRVSMIPVGVLSWFFMELDTLILKLIWKSKRSRIVMKFPEKNIRWFALPDTGLI